MLRSGLFKWKHCTSVSGIDFFSTSSKTLSSSKLYEMRKYTVKPECVGKFKKLTTDLFHLRTEKSKSLGYWFTEIGTALFQVVHVWEFDSLSHRASVRQNLDKDEAWQNEYIKYAMPCLMQLENSLLRVPNWFQVEEKVDKQGGIYELSSYDLSLENKSASIERLKLSIENDSSQNIGDLLYVWYTDIGEQKQAWSLWRFGSYEEKMNFAEIRRKQNDVDKIPARSTVMMLPAPWSPMQ